MPIFRARRNKDSLGTLRVQVAGCTNLLPGDLSGSSDPYVAVTLGRKVYETPVIKKSLNPTFTTGNTFDLPISRELARGTGLKLKLVVWDKDWVGPRDYLGEVVLRVEDWFPSGDSRRPLAWSTAESLEAYSVPLVSTRAGIQSQGEIRLRLGFVSVRGQDENHERVYGQLISLASGEDDTVVWATGADNDFSIRNEWGFRILPAGFRALQRHFKMITAALILLLLFYYA
ncbi:phosphatidylserine decarboxylase [Marasmius tenuissimus]|uniref:Phosphatidylserine decarboxylase n=1 Tax=Marasmius tenuissimus TaxID=585030 RepID=A0ABR2ZXV9_9AGAR